MEAGTGLSQLPDSNKPTLRSNFWYEEIEAHRHTHGHTQTHTHMQTPLISHQWKISIWTGWLDIHPCMLSSTLISASWSSLLWGRENELAMKLSFNATITWWKILYRDSLGCGIIYLIANAIFLCGWLRGGERLSLPREAGIHGYNNIPVCSMLFCFQVCLPKQPLHLLPSISCTPEL